MATMRAIKDEVAGKAKRLVGEITGDQKLYDEGAAQEQQHRDDSEIAAKSADVRCLERRMALLVG